MSRDDKRRRLRAVQPAGLDAEVVVDAGDWSAFGDVEALAESSTHAVAASSAWPAGAGSTVTIALSDDERVQELNRRFRGFDKPTNVLSFPNGGAAVDGEPRPLGDIVLAVETVERQAAEMAIPRTDHLRHLVVHGLLHLLGYDHERDADAEIMEALEIEILAGFGVADPYADAPAHPHLLARSQEKTSAP